MNWNEDTDWSDTMFETHNNGRQTCKLCGDTLSAETPRINIGYSSNYGHKEMRICGDCVMEQARVLMSMRHGGAAAAQEVSTATAE